MTVVYQVYTDYREINALICTNYQKIRTHVHTRIVKNDTQWVARLQYPKYIK